MSDKQKQLSEPENKHENQRSKNNCTNEKKYKPRKHKQHAM